MSDQRVLIVVEKGVDDLGGWIQIVAVHHDGNRGNGDPNEEFYAYTLNGFPGGGITTMTKSEFAVATKDVYPWLFEIVNSQFSKAKRIRAKKKIRAIANTRTVTSQFLSKALRVVMG